MLDTGTTTVAKGRRGPSLLEVGAGGRFGLPFLKASVGGDHIGPQRGVWDRYQQQQSVCSVKVNFLRERLLNKGTSQENDWGSLDLTPPAPRGNVQLRPWGPFSSGIPRMFDLCSQSTHQPLRGHWGLLGTRRYEVIKILRPGSDPSTDFPISKAGANSKCRKPLAGWSVRGGSPQIEEMTRAEGRR